MSLETVKQSFEKLRDDEGNVISYQSVVIENGSKTTSIFNLDFSLKSKNTTVVFDNLKTLEEMSQEFQTAWNDINGNNIYNVDNLKFSTRENGLILVVSEGDETIFGRIDNWSNEDTWTDWNGREVTNTNYSYNFSDGDWNFIGSSGGYSRDVAFESGSHRWDGEEVTVAETVTDETGSHLSYRVKAPIDGESADAWTTLDPGAALLDKLGLDWSDIVEVRVGANSWTQLDTDGATRDEEYESSDRQIKLFVQHEDGWSEYAGRLEYRYDGIIEVRDESWNLVARTVDLTSDNVLDWSDLTVETSPHYVAGLSEAWDKVGKYLPSALRDDDSTADIDERDALHFTKGQRGDLNVFSTQAELLARVDTWENDGFHETSFWDESANTHVEGFEYNTNTSFNFNDGDYGQLARFQFEENHFLSKADVDSLYNGEPPADFSEINLEHVVLRSTYEMSGFSAKKSELEPFWDTEVQAEYGIPSAASTVEDIWDWSDVTSLFIETTSWVGFDYSGDEESSNLTGRIHYQAEGYWKDGDFIALSDHNENDGPLSNYHIHEKLLGVIDTRDGFIEVRDGNWDIIGRFVDLANAKDFGIFAPAYEGLDSAWDALNEVLQATWGSRDNLKFASDSSDNILVINQEGILLGRIDNWSNEDTWTDWNGREVTNTNYSYNFNDSDWNFIGSSGGYSRDVAFESGSQRWDDEEVTAAETVKDETGSHVNYGVKAPIDGESADAWTKLDPGAALLLKLELDWSDIVEVRVGASSWTQLDTDGATRDEEYKSSDRQIELFVQHEDGWSEYAGRLEYRYDGIIEVRDESWNLVARTVDLTSDNVLDWSDLTVETSPHYVAGLSEAWDKVGKYLPSALRDDDSTADIDERDALHFTKGQRGDLNVFSTQAELLARVDTGENDGFHETSFWDESANTHVEGFEYNTNTSFNFNDEDWGQLARFQFEENHFLSKADVDSLYNGEPPADFSEINLEHVVLRSTYEKSGFSAKESELEPFWDTEVQAEYGIPSAASAVENIWDWSDVTSLFIETTSWVGFDYSGDEESSNLTGRIHYQAEGYWKDGDFIALSDHNENDGPLSNYHIHEKLLGVIDTRDGFIEVRDGNWDIIGRFVDLANAKDFGIFAPAYEGLDSAWDALNEVLQATWGSRDNLKFASDSSDNILVINQEGILLGRIDNWSNEDTWTDWNGREVTNTNYSYNFNDSDWNFIGSSGGYSRDVAFESGSQRWDDEEVTAAETVKDETGSHVNYGVKAPIDGESADAWTELDPGAALLLKLELDWSDIVEVRVGANSWTQLDTDGATRDEEYKSSDRQIELFVQHEDGWSEYAGRLEYRSDGFIEVRDESWNLVARTVDLMSDNVLDWSDLTVETSAHYVAGLSEAWDKVGKYLPSALRDDDSTADIDERDALHFTKSQWGDLNVFSAQAELLARVDTWENDFVHETSFWDDSTDTDLEGFEYNQGPTFNFNDEDWGQLARFQSGENYFLSKADVDTLYDGVPPENFSEINLEHVVLRSTVERSGFSAKKSELEPFWDTEVQAEYGIPSAASAVENIWDWSDVTSIFIETDEWTDFKYSGEFQNEGSSSRVQYQAEGYWKDGEFIALSDHDEDDGPLSNYDIYEKLLGVIDTRDGFIQIRDGNWDEVGRFVDVTDAEGFEDFAPRYEGLGSAWNAVNEYLPTLWSSRDALKFTSDSSDNILVMSSDGTLLGRINSWFDQQTFSQSVRESIGYNFRFEDQFGEIQEVSFNSYARSENGILRYTDTDIRISIARDVLSNEKNIEIGPIENDAGLTTDKVASVFLDESTQINYDIAGDFVSSSFEQQVDYFDELGDYLGRQENYSGSITLFDANDAVVGSEFTSKLVPVDFLGANTSEILKNWLLEFEEQLDDLVDTPAVWSFMQIEGENSVALLSGGNVVSVGEIIVDEPNNQNEIYWDIRFESIEINLGGWNRLDEENSNELSLTHNGVKLSLLYYDDDDEFSGLVNSYAPPSNINLSGTVAADFDFENVEIVRFQTWYNGGPGNYEEKTELSFVPDDDSWDSKITNILRNDIFNLVDNDYNDIGVSWLNISSRDPDVEHSDYELHETTLVSVLGEDNLFSKAEYELINDKLLVLDINKDGLTDFYVTGAANGESWQQLISINSLEQVGGIYADAVYDYARLPSDFAKVKMWSENFKTSFSQLNPDQSGDFLRELDYFLQKNLTVQIQLFKGAEGNEWDTAIGLRFMDGESSEARLWLTKLSNDSYEASFKINGSAEISVSIDEQLYLENEAALNNLVELSRLPLSVNLDADLTSLDAFNDFSVDSNSVSSAYVSFFNEDFATAIGGLYGLRFKASAATSDEDFTYVELAGDGNLENYLKFMGNLTVEDVNAAFEDPSSNEEIFEAFVGIQSINPVNNETLLSISLEETGLNVSNLSGPEGKEISISFEGSSINSLSGLSSVISAVYQLVTRDSDQNNATFSELVEGLVIEQGLDRFTVFEGENTILDILGENQESETTSLSMEFGNSSVALESDYSNISDVLSEMNKLGNFDPILIAQMTAGNNTSSDIASVTFSNNGVDLMALTLEGVGQFSDFDLLDLITDANASKTDSGYVFSDNENIHSVEVTAGPDLSIADTILFFEADIL